MRDYLIESGQQNFKRHCHQNKNVQKNAYVELPMGCLHYNYYSHHMTATAELQLYKIIQSKMLDEKVLLKLGKPDEFTERVP